MFEIQLQPNPPALVHPVRKQLAMAAATHKAISMLSADAGPRSPIASVRSHYMAAIRPTVTVRDAQYGESLDSRIQAALFAGEAGEADGADLAETFSWLMQAATVLTDRHELQLGREKLLWGERHRSVHNVDEVIAYSSPLWSEIRACPPEQAPELEAEWNGVTASLQTCAAEGDLEGYWWGAAYAEGLAWLALSLRWPNRVGDGALRHWLRPYHPGPTRSGGLAAVREAAVRGLQILLPHARYHGKTLRGCDSAGRIALLTRVLAALAGTEIRRSALVAAGRAWLEAFWSFHAEAEAIAANRLLEHVEG